MTAGGPKIVVLSYNAIALQTHQRDLATCSITMSQHSALGFCPVLDEMVRSRKVEGRSGKQQDISSVSSINNLTTLRHLHLSSGADRTLEIGLRSGGSALVFAQTHYDLAHSPSQQHVAIDPFQRSHWIDETGLVAIEKAGLSGYLDWREDYACYALPKLAQEKRSFQIIYVDGSHLFEDVFVDLFFAIRLLEIGGMILFDDSSNPHIHKVLSFTRGNMRHVLAERDLSPFRPAGSSNWKYRVARRLRKIQLRGFEKIGAVERAWDSRFSSF